METVVETLPKIMIQTGKLELETKTLPLLPKADQNPQNSAIDLRKTSTPDRLKVPKAFKYPERYTSPTDSVMSPISKGLLRNRRGGVLLPPSLIHFKHQIKDLLIQEPCSSLKADAAGI